MSQPLKEEKLEFPERVILLRNRMGVTQAKFGKAIGVSDEYVSQIEKGKRDPGETVKILISLLEEQFQLREAADSNSVQSPVAAREDSVEYKTADEWKAEALKLRAEVTRLKVVIQILASTARPVSSNEAFDAEQFVTDIVNRIAAQAAEKSPPAPKPGS